jgi:phage tail-like protein
MPEDAIKWPLPRFYFAVELGDDKDVTFQEVTGLQTETKVIEYRHGNSPNFSTIKMPGLRSVGNVTMKKGIFAKDAKFFTWFLETKKFETFKRRVVIVKLLDEGGQAKMTWTLNNAWPTKVTGTDLKSDGNEVAVESIEIAFETINVEAA